MNDGILIEIKNNMDTISYGGAIKTIRLNSGLTAEAFASKIGVNKKTLTDIEEGRVDTPHPVLYLIELQFKIPFAAMTMVSVTAQNVPEENLSVWKKLKDPMKVLVADAFPLLKES